MSHFLLLVLVECDPTAKHWRATPDHDFRKRLRELMADYYCRELSDRPSCKCDGYVVGGWYDGVLYGKPAEHNLTPDQVRGRFGAAFEKVRFRENIRPVNELPESVQPFAVVCPSGTWIDMTSDGRSEIARALALNSDRLAIAVDCHC